MIRKLLTGIVLAFVSMSATALDQLYLIGPATPVGWEADHAMEMTKRDNDVFTIVCYLDNSDGKTFRFQSGKEFTVDNSGYYSAAIGGTPLVNNVEADIMEKVDNGFSVAHPGVYLITADIANMKVKLNRMNEIYAVGNIVGNWWMLPSSRPLSLVDQSNDNASVYSGVLHLKEGEGGRLGDFKFALDPANGSWNSGYFLQKDEANSGHFKSSVMGDTKWTVGQKPDENGTSPDLAPGRYRVLVDVVAKTVSFSPITVNMPLKEADFADGKAHYFLVGQRMGAWRLQPEWEFISQEDGSYAIPERLLYNGYVMVGMVDNYEDYVTQTYFGYSASDTVAKTKLDPHSGSGEQNFEYPLALLPAAGDNGCENDKFTSTRYDNISRTSTPAQHGGFDAMELRLINICDPDGFGDMEHIQSMPSRVTAIRLIVDYNGVPASLLFEGVNSNAAEVAKLRTFSFCGSGIRNLDIPYVNGVSTTPMNNQVGSGGREWADAWIQFSEKDKPYVDGYGEYIYQTSFTANWLKTHPSYFKFSKDGEASGMEYTSNNITFHYRPDLKHDPQFGRRQVTDSYGLVRNEVLYTYSTLAPEGYGTNKYAKQNLDDEMIVNSDNLACFAVENVWMEGDFKIWCGWGGSATNFEYDDNGTHYYRWYGSNASHGAAEENRTAFYSAGDVMAYTLFRDVPSANFAIGYGPIWNVTKSYDSEGNLQSSEKTLNPNVDETGRVKDGVDSSRRFYKRVEIWFNLKSGFSYMGKDADNKGDASFIVFYQELRGPQIHIDKTDVTHINYTYSIQDVNNMPLFVVDRNYGLITYYRVERIPLDSNGNEGEYTIVEENSFNHDSYMTSEDFARKNIQDPISLASGRYRYRVTVKRENTGDAEFSAKSNVLSIVAPPVHSGVEEISVSKDDAPFSMKLSAAGGRLRVEASSEIGRLRIYSMGGLLVKSVDIPFAAGMADVSDLAPGIYVANANNQSLRFVIR